MGRGLQALPTVLVHEAAGHELEDPSLQAEELPDAPLAAAAVRYGDLANTAWRILHEIRIHERSLRRR